MSYKERLTILHTAEINDLYGIPSLSLDEKRVSFALNDLELDAINSISYLNAVSQKIAFSFMYNPEKPAISEAVCSSHNHPCYILNFFRNRVIARNPPVYKSNWLF